MKLKAPFVSRRRYLAVMAAKDDLGDIARVLDSTIHQVMAVIQRHDLKDERRADLAEDILDAIGDGFAQIEFTSDGRLTARPEAGE